MGRLVAATPNARINLRDQPSTSTPTERYGLEGDRVVLQETTTGSDGYTWHKVQFQASGAIGWVRADFVEF
ncbi:SH3 domain-containing protein [Microcoleus sp. FACHB-1515]|nr:SH3 domain-containing protein [Microcoleus sp. FACHB-1515]